MLVRRAVDPTHNSSLKDLIKPCPFPSHVKNQVHTHPEQKGSKRIFGVVWGSLCGPDLLVSML